MFMENNGAVNKNVLRVQAWRLKHPNCRKEEQKRRRAQSPEKIRAAAKKWREKNPDYAKWHSRKVKYGLTKAQIEAILETQRNCCGICGDILLLNNVHVDHDHSTGRVRGLLCLCCNSGMGQLRDSIQILEKAIAYLKK